MHEELREAYRGGRIVKCQFITEWEGSDHPKYVHAFEPKTGIHFVVSQRMGAWMDVDVGSVVHRLNTHKEILAAEFQRGVEHERNAPQNNYLGGPGGM